MKLQGALKGLICEIASLDSIIDAIKNRQVVVIYYDGDEPGGRGIREIEPVCLGVSKSGNKVLRAWDSEGASHTGYKGEQPLPGWRLFRLDKILSNKPTGEVYNTPRPGYNFNGDKSMTSVIINAVFDNNTTEPPTPEPQPTNEPPTPEQENIT
jgi:predicted DNA-binding transcriptional regulator YafY